VDVPLLEAHRHGIALARPLLRALVLALDALRQVAGRDLRRRCADRLQRLEAEAHDPEPEQGDAGKHQRRHQQCDQQQAMQCAVDIVQ